MASNRLTKVGPNGNLIVVKVGGFTLKNGMTEDECKWIRDAVSEIGFSKIKFVTGKKAERKALNVLLELSHSFASWLVVFA